MKDRIQYGYDRAGNRTWRKNLVAPENQDQHYLYDPLYQVTAAARGNLNLNQTAIGGIPAQRQTFSYDPTGNWDRYTTTEDGVEVLDQTRIHNQANQITQIDGSNVGLLYDRAGNATQMPPDAAGDWGEHYKLTWDTWNRLVKVEDQNEEVVASYAYDGTTRRTTKTIGEEVTHTYYNERWKAAEERQGDSEEAHLQYLWGARPNHRDELVRRDRDADDSGSLEEKFYCLMDYFDPTSVTDEDGNIQERYQFSAFGLRSITNPYWTSRADSDFDFEFGFHGQLRDVETRFYNYGYRYYNVEPGRWLSKDPIKEMDDVNLYCSSKNNPLAINDFVGLCEECCCLQSIGLDILNPFYYFTDPILEQGYRDMGLPPPVAIGTSFAIALGLKYSEEQRMEGGDCTYTWEEKSDRPIPGYLEMGIKPNEWADVTSVPASGFEEWPMRMSISKSGRPVRLYDKPMLGIERSRVLEFRITAMSGVTCQDFCSFKTGQIRAIQVIRDRKVEFRLLEASLQ